MKIVPSVRSPIYSRNTPAPEKSQQPHGSTGGTQSARARSPLLDTSRLRSRGATPVKRDLPAESALGNAPADASAKRPRNAAAAQGEVEEIFRQQAQRPNFDDGSFDLATALAQAGYANKLSGVTFSDSGVFFPKNASVNGVDFEHCTFVGNALSDVRFSKCGWKNCIFDNVCFGQAKLSHCLFEKSHFVNAMFVGTSLDNVVFDEGELFHCSFEDATIANAKFKTCTLHGTHFLNASISNSHIGTSNIKDAFFAGTTGSRFDMDSETERTAGTTRAAVTTLVSPGTWGVSVPRVGAKLDTVAQVTPLRVAMQSSKQSKEQINAEVQRLLGRVCRDETATLSVAQQVMTLADEDPAANPGISAIVAKARAMVGQTDAVVLPGGEDVPPSLYGASAGEHTDWGGDYRRSIMELALIREAFKRGLPLMAICRGFQMTNVYFGASLLQHVGDEQRGLRRMPAEGRRDGSAGLYGDALKDLQTAVYHHQAVPSDQESLRYIEPSVIRNNWVMAVEPIHSGAAPIIGVQFHPEFFDSAKAAGLKLSDEQLVKLSQTARASGKTDSGLRDPRDLVDSGVIHYMSPNNDKLWRVLSDAANTYRNKKTAVRPDALRYQKSRLREVASAG